MRTCSSKNRLFLEEFSQLSDCPVGMISLSLAVVPCQLRCAYCCSADWSCLRTKPLAEFQQLVEEVTHFRSTLGSIPVSFYLLDEPANHPNIADMLQLLNSHGYGSGWLPTNGGRIAQEENWQDLLNSLMDAGLRTVHLSVYGLEQTHDILAGRRGAYRIYKKITSPFGSFPCEKQCILMYPYPLPKDRKIRET